MRVSETELPGVRCITPTVHRDARGVFWENWHEERDAQAGLPRRFVQDNISRSRQGVLRGLHFQHPHGQGKLVSVPHGEILDVAVDVRRGSPHFGRWVAQPLSADNGLQLWIPAGFAHGFLVTSPEAIVAYKCTDFYHPEAERTARWDDSELRIDWPVADPLLSPKDRDAPRLAEIPPDQLPPYTAP